MRTGWPECNLRMKSRNPGTIVENGEKSVRLVQGITIGGYYHE